MGSARGRIQASNLLRDGDTCPYGMLLERSPGRALLDRGAERFGGGPRRARSRSYNRTPPDLTKRGVAVMPVCFGISFTTTFLNQASALVHVYTDGSVRVTTGAVEMGQGVDRQDPAASPRRAAWGRPGAGSASRAPTPAAVANTSPTAASTGADLNGMAARAGLPRRSCGACGRSRPTARLDAPPRWTIARSRSGGGQGTVPWPGTLVGAAYTPAREPLGARPLRDPGDPLRQGRASRAAVRLPRLRHRACRGDPRQPSRHLRGRPCASSTTPAAAWTRGSTAARSRAASSGRRLDDHGGDPVPPDRRAAPGLTTYKVPDIYSAPRRARGELLDEPRTHARVQLQGGRRAAVRVRHRGLLRSAHRLRSVRTDRELPSLPVTPERVMMQLAGERPL